MVKIDILKKANLQRVIFAVLLFVIAVFFIAVYVNKKSNMTYIIDSYEELAELSKRVNSGNDYNGKTVELANDIMIPSDSEWVPIGAGDNVFKGTFNGKGHNIDGVACKPNSDAGLFGNLEGTVCNLIVGAGRFAESQKVGVIAVNVKETGSVLNCLSEAYPGSKEGGGICYKLDGTVINCVACSSEDFSNRYPLYVEGSDEYMNNCFSGKGGYQELYDTISSEKTKENKMNQAIADLNNRLPELEIEYENIDFCKWESGKLYPHLTDKCVEIPQFTIKGEKLEYDKKLHGYVGNDSENIMYIHTNSSDYSIDIPQGMDTIYYCLDDIIYKIIINTDYLEADIEGNVELSDLDSLAFENYIEISEDNIITGRGSILHKNKSGKIEVTGELSGQIVLHNGGKIVLNNACVKSNRGPAVLFEVADAENEIEIEQNTDNILSGCASRDIYSADRIWEGVIESENSLSIRSLGSLTIEGTLEGIESQKELEINEGNYYINSVDDGISAKKAYINGGYFFINAGDDVIDTDKLFELNGGIVVGQTPIEFGINGRPSSINEGKIALFSAKGIINLGEERSGESKQCRVQFTNPDNFKEGETIAIATDDKILVAAKVPYDIAVFNYSEDFMKNKKLRLYSVTDVVGEFKNGFCFNPDSYTIKNEFFVDGGDELITEEDGIFEVK